LVVATVLFAVSFGVVFIPFGLGVAWLAQFVSIEHVMLTRIVGVVLLLFAVGSLVGWTLPNRKRPQRGQNGAGVWGAAVLGLTFGFTASSCIAPVLGAIITASVGEGDPANAFVLLVWFVVGMFTPLLMLSFLIQRYGQQSLHTLFTWGFEVTLGGKEYRLYWAQVCAALLFTGLGLLYVCNMPTVWLGGLSSGGLQDWFFTMNQRLLGY
jgi:cytochrome c biogenesis protein CcdA